MGKICCRQSSYTRGVFDVFRTTKIFRRPGPKCRSMSRGRRIFYVTSRRIFADPEEFFERTMLGKETVMMHISKPANRTSNQRNGNMFLKGLTHLRIRFELG